MDMANQAGVKIASLSVIHSLNVNHIIEIYEFFKSKKIPMKFNPMFNSGNAVYYPEYKLDLDVYTNSLKKFFDYWIVDQNAVKVDPLDQYIQMKLFGKSSDCIYGSCLYRWLGIDHKGDFYPCGRSYPATFRLASISEINHISDVFKTENFICLLKSSIIRRSECQADCMFFGVCKLNNFAVFIRADSKNFLDCWPK